MNRIEKIMRSLHIRYIRLKQFQFESIGCEHRGEGKVDFAVCKTKKAVEKLPGFLVQGSFD